MTSPEQAGRKRGRLPSIQDQIDTFNASPPLTQLSISPPSNFQSQYNGSTASTSTGPQQLYPVGYTSPSQPTPATQRDVASGAPSKAKPKASSSGSKRGTPSASFRNVSACNRCRVRKNRCDQQLPACEACERAGAKCVGWDPFLGRAVPRSYVYFLETRVAYLEDLLQKNAIEYSSEENFPSLTDPVIKRDDKGDSGSRAGSAEGNHASSAGYDERQSPKLKLEDINDARIDKLVSNIDKVSMQGNAEPRNLASTSSISFAKVVLHAVKTTVTRRNSEQIANKSSQTATEAETSTMRDSVFGLQSKANFKEAPFPDKDLGLKLVDLYFEYANPQIPTLHRGEFMSLFERVYAPKHQRTPKESYLLNIVFALGAGTIFDRAAKGDAKRFEEESSQHGMRGPAKRARLSGFQYQPEEYHAAAIVHLESFRGLTTADGYGGGLEELQAVLLLAGFALLRPVAPGLWYIAGVAMRLAVDLGLHYEDGVDPSEKRPHTLLGRGDDIYPGGTTSATLDQTEIGRREWVRDLRRRLWWCTYTFDRLVSTVVGRPFSISDQIVTTSFPSIKDDKFITPTGFVESPNANPPSYKLVAFHYFRLRLLQSEIVQVLQYQSAKKAFSNKREGEMDPYIHSDLNSPFLEHFVSFGSWRKDMDRRLWLWKESAPTADQTGVAFNPQFLELNYWQALILLYRQSVTTPEALAADESDVKDGISSPHSVDVAPESDEDTEFVYARIAEAGQKILCIYRHLHRMHLVNYTYLATHHLFLAGISFLYAIWYSPMVRTNLTIDEVNSTILGGLSVLEDLTTVCPPALSCKDAFDRMSRTVLQVAQATTGFGTQAIAAINATNAKGGSHFGSPTSAPLAQNSFPLDGQLGAAPSGYRFDTGLSDLFAEDQLSPASSMFWDPAPSSFGNDPDLLFLEEFEPSGGNVDGANVVGTAAAVAGAGAGGGVVGVGGGIGSHALSNFHSWNIGAMDGSHDWSEGNGTDFFGGFFFGGGGGGMEVVEPGQEAGQLAR